MTLSLFPSRVSSRHDDLVEDLVDDSSLVQDLVDLTTRDNGRTRPQVVHAFRGKHLPLQGKFSHRSGESAF